MRGNVVLAAVVFAVGLVLAAAVAVFGARWVANGAMDRFQAAAREHGEIVARGVEGGGDRAGTPIRRGLEDSIAKLSGAVEDAGGKISRPVVDVQGPLSIKEPLKIRGIKDDGSLPVNATIGK